MPEILENAEEDHGQETHLHKQAGYIDADFLHSQLFPCSQTADHTFRQVRLPGGMRLLVKGVAP
jgi:hypothetical protein